MMPNNPRDPHPAKVRGTIDATPGDPSPAFPLVDKSSNTELTALKSVPVHPILSTPPNIFDLLRALQRRWLLATVVGLVLAVPAAALVWYLLPPPKHAAYTILRYERDNLPAAKGPKENAFNFRLEQTALVKSTGLLNKTLKVEGVAALPLIQKEITPVDYLRQNVQVSFPMGPQFIKLALSGDDERSVITLVNAVKTIYMEELKSQENDQRVKTLERLREMLDEYNGRIDTKRKTLEKLEATFAVDPTEEAKIQLQFFQELRGSLIEVQKEMFFLRVEFGSQLPPELASIPPELVFCLMPQPDLTSRLSQIALLHDDKHQVVMRGYMLPQVVLDRDMIDKALDNHPALVDLKQSMDAWAKHKSLLEQGSEKFKEADTSHKWYLEKWQSKREELRPQITQDLRTQLQEAVLKQAAPIREKFNLFKAKQAALEQLLAGQELEINKGKLNNHGARKLQDEIGPILSFIKTVNEEIHKLEVQNKYQSEITEWQEVTLTQGEAGLKHIMTSAGSGLGVLGLVLLGFAFVEYRQRKVYSTSQVVHGLGMRLIGTVPDYSQQSRFRLLGMRIAQNPHWERMFTDSIDAARTMIYHAALKKGIKVVAITSAVPGEGKTSVATHLAASLGRAGHKTLLIDGDLRKPTLHKLFDLDPAPGLGDLLTGDCDLSTALRDEVSENLSIITSGRGDRSSVQALLKGGLVRILDQVRAEYEFIIIDSSPVLPTPDALTIASNADAVIFSILREVSQISRVYTAFHRVALTGAAIIGTIVSGTHDDVYSYSSRHYYYRHEAE